jgi:lysophospholipase L1-like esterase
LALRKGKIAADDVNLPGLRSDDVCPGEKEAKRQAVNQWIRSSGAFDGVIDFDAATRDSSDPKHIRADYDSGDHLHPQDTGYKAMADSIDLVLLGVRQ